MVNFELLTSISLVEVSWTLYNRVLTLVVSLYHYTKMCRESCGTPGYQIK